MRKQVIVTAFAVLCASLSVAEARPGAGLQGAVVERDSSAELLQPASWGHRHHWRHGYYSYYRPYYYKPWYGYRYSYWRPRWHWHRHY